MSFEQSCPLPTEDLTGFLSWHRDRFGGATMTGPDQPPAPPAPTPAPPAPTPPAPTPPAQPRTFTQEEVTALAAREKDEGKRAAEKALQDALGVDLETAKAMIKAQKDREDADKTEAQRAREAADAEKAQAESEKSTAAKTTHMALVTTEFVLAGITDRAKIERYSRLLDVEVGAKQDAIAKAVEKLKTEEPGIFGAQTPPPPGNRPPAPPSDPGGQPPAPQQTSDKYKAGLERAAQYGRPFTAAQPPAPVSGQQ